MFTELVAKVKTISMAVKGYKIRTISRNPAVYLPFLRDYRTDADMKSGHMFYYD